MGKQPWEVRPKQDRGDSNPIELFTEVGFSLTAWEAWEADMAELFDVLVASQPSNRAAFGAFISVRTASARTEMIDAAFKLAIKKDDPAHADVASMIHDFGKFGARRNEIAHGRVYNLGEWGFMLAPNNTMPHKFSDDGAAKYQYIAADVRHYREWFIALQERCAELSRALRERAADKTAQTNSSRDRRGKRT
jgi:hypothetical protein